jgi:hypothetical protein
MKREEVVHGVEVDALRIVVQLVAFGEQPSHRPNGSPHGRPAFEPSGA